MSHRMLFFLSVIVIIVGLIGIVTQISTSSKTQEETPSETPGITEKKTKTIVIAEALRDLNPRDILAPTDYVLKTLDIDGDSDVRDISSLTTSHLNGFLVHNKIPKNSVIFPGSIESPNSNQYVFNRLADDELTYSYIVYPENEHFLSSIKPGDDVSLYIRLIEVDKGKTSQVTLVSEGSPRFDNSLQKFTLNKIVDRLNVLQVNQYERTSPPKITQPVGDIVFRVDHQQLAELRVVDKVGELLLFPSTGENHKKIRMDEVLPQFKSIKELRGRK